jgi:anti-sigma regulatory factor (Ser/Thr protein kinase)
VDTAVLDTCFELEIRADARDVRGASAWLEQSGIATEVPSDQISRLDLCLNEALANIIEHGGPTAQASPVSLSFIVQADVATLIVTDSGHAFNPLESVPKTMPQSLAEAEPGGLGLGLMCSFADEVGYHYHQGRNCLRLTVRWSSNP